MKVETSREKTVLIGLMIILLCFVGASTVWAGIPRVGGDDYCNLCHESGGGGGGGKPLRTEYQGPEGCVNCHSSAVSSTTYNLVGGGQTVIVPVVNYTGGSLADDAPILAGGNFWWVQTDDTKGHNIFTDDLNYTRAPGSAVGCDSIPGMCHQNLHETNTLGMPGLQNRQGCTKCHMLTDDFDYSDYPEGFHHADDEVDLVVGDSVQDPLTSLNFDGFFRFLHGHQSGDNHGVCGIEDDDWQDSSSPTDHNEYLGYSGNKNSAGNLSAVGHTVTGYCGGCHGNFHISLHV